MSTKDLAKKREKNQEMESGSSDDEYQENEAISESYEDEQSISQACLYICLFMCDKDCSFFCGFCFILLFVKILCGFLALHLCFLYFMVSHLRKA